jgi:DNA repair protein RadC
VTAIVQSPLQNYLMNYEEVIIAKAFAILAKRLNAATISIGSPEIVESYLLHKLMAEEREIFGALWLDVKNRLITVEDIALGTLSKTAVYPREILKSALKYNAANVIFYHNHPTGDARASDADKVMTREMKRLLRFIDVQLLDHVIVSGTKTNSLARGEAL